MMKPVLLGALALALVAPLQATAEDNIAACEIVVLKRVDLSKVKKSEDSLEETENVEWDDGEAAPLISTFIPAHDFIASVFDDEPGHITDVNGQLIKALMCKRRYLIPTEFDLRLIRTGIPLYLSQDFDSTESDMMTVFHNGNQYLHKYSGSELSEAEIEILQYRMKMLNLPTQEQE